MVRLSANGVIDSSFGENGLVITDIGPNEKSTASVLQPDGKIILGGTDYKSNFAIARYNNDIQNTNQLPALKMDRTSYSALAKFTGKQHRLLYYYAKQ